MEHSALHFRVLHTREAAVGPGLADGSVFKPPSLNAAFRCCNKVQTASNRDTVVREKSMLCQKHLDISSSCTVFTTQAFFVAGKLFGRSLGTTSHDKAGARLLSGRH